MKDKAVDSLFVLRGRRAKGSGFLGFWVPVCGVTSSLPTRKGSFNRALVSDA